MRIKLASFNVAGFAVLQLLLRLSAGLTGAGASLLAQIPTIFQEPDTHYAVHHTVVSASSWSKSLRFYVDGLGLNIIRIHTFQGDLTTLFGTNTSVLPSYFLGDTTSVHNGTDGVTYLVEFPDAKKIPTVDSNPPDTGLFLTSFWMGDKINATLEYLHRLGIGGKPHIATFSFGSEPLATYATAQLMSQAGLGQVISILPVLGESFGIGNNMGQLSWFPAAYSLTVGTFILGAGRLGDLYGHKLLFTAGFFWLTIWTLFAAFAESIGPLFFCCCRVLQGIGPAFLLPNGMAILARSYEPGILKEMVFSAFESTAPSGFIFGGLFSALAAKYQS
ncbi:hypothetical protein IFM46972_10561 [Aspergillus udagawae]|uniref:Major facilitator superfamily (MFS) profile domain-containing protein n=1 Tax=Aspergillus udagawae TaxID=91492 RepID=A0A8H3XQE6_9EURO|nr:hypothetical protein IFM46972_10561 [Aspergillus udagawae]